MRIHSFMNEIICAWQEHSVNGIQKVVSSQCLNRVQWSAIRSLHQNTVSSFMAQGRPPIPIPIPPTPRPCSARKSGERYSGRKIISNSSFSGEGHQASKIWILLQIRAHLDSLAGELWGNLVRICIYTSFTLKYQPRFADIWTEPRNFL